jgi:hypothetical protein
LNFFHETNREKTLLLSGGDDAVHAAWKKRGALVAGKYASDPVTFEIGTPESTAY